VAWYEGELFPTGPGDRIGKEWADAPVSAMVNGSECSHDHVVLPENVFNPDTPVMTQGRVPLHCLDCESTWWEDAAMIKGSPWEGK
jgi:hypothetical protein